MCWFANSQQLMTQRTPPVASSGSRHTRIAISRRLALLRMRFLAEEEAMALLDEVVAFMVACDSADVITANSEDSSSVPENDDVASEASEAATTSSLPKHELKLQEPENPKRRRTSSTSTQLQRRKKVEFHALRTLVQELEAELEQRKPVAFGGHKSHVASHFGESVGSESLRELSQKQSALRGEQDLHSAFEKPTPTGRHPLRAINNSTSIITLLEKPVEDLHLHSSHVFQPETPSSISCSLMVKHDTHRGKAVEITTTTPMACSMEAASALLRKLLTTQCDYVDKTYLLVRL
ncbi:hypothetical protein BBJ28_00002938 [Nothophytophthora sp. Chile5]|nr:hypothetical protein BBJ28_00002938 [Nothophytophthora sp. Chile5]